MSLLKRPRSLTDRIPEDVRERARKAGVEEIDWYAGRLDATNVGANHSFTDPPQEDIAQLKAVASKRRRANRADAKEAVVTRLRELWRRRPHRHARPAE